MVLFSYKRETIDSRGSRHRQQRQPYVNHTQCLVKRYCLVTRHKQMARSASREATIESEREAKLIK